MATTRRWVLGLCACAVPTLTACTDDAAGPTAVTGRAGLRVGMDFVARSLPSGDVEVTAGVVDLDTINRPIDLFDRAIPTLPLWDSPRVSETFELATDFGRKNYWAPRWFKIDGLSDQRDDPRSPFLVENPNIDPDFGDALYPAAIDMFRVRSPTSFMGQFCTNGPCWTIMMDLDNIGPDSAWVAMGLVRYAVQVNGLVDHLELWVEGQVLEPDALVLLGGAPGGYPEHQADHWHEQGNNTDPAACPQAPSSANPFIFGHARLGATSGNVDPKDPGADFSGETDADWCFTSTGVWDDTETGLTPLAPNEFVSFDFPQYNYFVVWEFDEATNTILYDRPLLRAQIGVDLDLNGNPIPHAFAPFPFPIAHAYNVQFPTLEDFLAHPAVAAGAQAVEMIVRDLKPLAGGRAYQIWTYDEVEGETVRVPARYVLQRPDTVGVDELGEPIIQWVDVGDTALVQSFNGEFGHRHVVVVRNRDVEELGIRLSQFTHVVLTIGGNGDADPASYPTPVWYRYTDQNGTRQDLFDNELFLSGSTSVHFDPSRATLAIGWKAFGGGSVEFMSDVGFGVRLDRLARPPLGYYYGIWLWNEATGAAVSGGPITTPAPEFASLRDADLETGPFVTSTEILQSVTWLEWAEVGADFRNYTHVLVTLEPKDGVTDRPAPTVVLEAAVPKDLDKLPTEREAS